MTAGLGFPTEERLVSILHMCMCRLSSGVRQCVHMCARVCGAQQRACVKSGVDLSV